MKNVETEIVENLDVIILNSLDEVSSLNNPVEKVLKTYFQKIVTPDTPSTNNVWIINSITRINEEIQKIITSSTDNLTVIVPNLDNYVTFEQLEAISNKLSIRLVSSESHTNSLVKKLKSITNLSYKSFQNEDLLLLKKDDDHIVIGISKKSSDILNDCVGIGSTFNPLIILLNPVVESIWQQAFEDTFYAQKAQTTARRKKILIHTTTQNKKEESTANNIPINTIKKPRLNKPPPKGQIIDLHQKLKEKIDFISAVQPKA